MPEEMKKYRYTLSYVVAGDIRDAQRMSQTKRVVEGVTVQEATKTLEQELVKEDNRQLFVFDAVNRGAVGKPRGPRVRKEADATSDTAGAMN